MENKLTERQSIEKIYHDKKYKDGIVSYSEKSENRAYKFFHNIIGDVNGLKVLDFGCGTGWMGIALAKSGAEVYGIDISAELIKKALQLAERERLSDKICFHEMPAEKLAFPNDYFDVIFGSAILHHTDVKIAMQNILRVLKPEGRAIFIEPMNQNILLSIWRKMTPWRRSPTEKALRDDDLKLIQALFPASAFHFFTFLSICTEGLLILSPTNSLLRLFNDFMEYLDSILLKSLPSLGKYSAVVVMILRKDKNGSPQDITLKRDSLYEAI